MQVPQAERRQQFNLHLSMFMNKRLLCFRWGDGISYADLAFVTKRGSTVKSVNVAFN